MEGHLIYAPHPTKIKLVKWKYGEDTSPHTRAVRSGRVGSGSWVAGRGPVGSWALGNGPSAQAAAAYLFSALRSPAKEPQSRFRESWRLTWSPTDERTNFSNRRGRRAHSLHFLGQLEQLPRGHKKGFAPGKAFTSENENLPF